MLLVIVKANLYGDNSFTTNGNFLVSNYGVKYNLLLTVNNIEILFKFRVGVTNAADRGLDMYSNWGPAIQIKHLSLDITLAENIVNSVSSDKIVIVCKDAEKDIIISLLSQIGWRSHIQSIVTENDLINWYEKALRGKYSAILGEKLLYCLAQEIAEEFPSVDTTPEIIKSRHYEVIKDDVWCK